MNVPVRSTLPWRAQLLKIQGNPSNWQSVEPTVSTRHKPAAMEEVFSKLHYGVVTDKADVVLFTSATLLGDE